MIIKEEINAALGKGLTQAQLDALHNARVAVVGLGGLGSNIAVALTRLGVSNLYLCGDGNSDFHDLPLCGARVTLCAMQQALLAARIILDLEEN